MDQLIEIGQQKHMYLRPVTKAEAPSEDPSGHLSEDNEFEELINYVPFIEANTAGIELEELKHKCIIPVFAKDNEKTIAHQEFIETALESVALAFPNMRISDPDIRVSHQIKGRIPEAIHKNVRDLAEHEKTQYYERMAFVIRLPEIVDTINGNELSLTIGGVRSYNQENLFNKKNYEKFKFFIGFDVKVCCNLCVSTDGYLEEMKAMSSTDLKNKMAEIMQNYDAEYHMSNLKKLPLYSLTEHQFAQLIGRSKLYHHLPKEEKALIPPLFFPDGHINTIARNYYGDANFSRDHNREISLWNLYNLFTMANKSSYIDTFLGRTVNATDFIKGIQKALDGNSDYRWFLS